MPCKPKVGMLFVSIVPSPQFYKVTRLVGSCNCLIIGAQSQPTVLLYCPITALQIDQCKMVYSISSASSGIVRYPRFPSSILCRYCDLCSLELKDQLLGQGQLNVSDARRSNFLQSVSKLLYLILDLKVSMGNRSRRLPFWTNLF